MRNSPLAKLGLGDCTQLEIALGDRRMLELKGGPPRTSRTQTVTLRPSDFDDMDTLMSGMPPLVGRAFFPGQYFVSRVGWNPHKLQLPDCIFRLLVDEDRESFHPEDSPLEILDTVRCLEEVEIRTSSPETCRLFTAALVQLCASGGSLVHGLDLSCHTGIIEEHTQDGIIEDLRALIPGLTEAGFSFNCPNLAMRIIEVVLPLGENLTALKFKCTTFDALLSLLASNMFPILREIHLVFNLSKGYFVENPNMDRLAEAIRSNSSLRSICIEGRFGVDTRLVEAILSNPTIVHVTYLEHTWTMTYLLTRISPEQVVLPRNIRCFDGEEHGLLLQVLPRTPNLLGWLNKGMDPKTIELVSPADLVIFATALRNPACGLRNIRAFVAPKLEVSADGFFAAVKDSTSLRSLLLFVLPSAAPVVDVLRGNLYLKEFGWIRDLDISGGGQHEALIDAAVANETIEAYYFQPDHLVWTYVSQRNVTLCVNRTRLLWISWISEWVDHGRFEPVLVFETIQMADLGWSEADRLMHQLAYERDIPTNLEEFKEACRTRSPEKKCCCS